MDATLLAKDSTGEVLPIDAESFDTLNALQLALVGGGAADVFCQ